MMMPRSRILPLLLSGLLLTVLFCAPAPAAQITGVTVDAANHQGNFVPGNLLDGNPATAWVGGGKGIGPGKWIELTFPSPITIHRLEIANGHQGAGQFNKFRRMTRGVIVYPDSTRQKFTLSPDKDKQTIKLNPKKTDSCKIVITGVAPAASDKNLGRAKVAVSEITIFGEMSAPTEKTEPVEVVEVVEVTEEPKPIEPKPVEPKPIESKTEKPAAPPAPKAAPKPTKKESKPATAPVQKEKPKATPPPAPVKKAEASNPAPKTATPKKVAPPKAAPKKVAVKKPAAKKTTKPKKKATPKKQAKLKSKGRPGISASRPGFTRLRASVPVSVDKPIEMGAISPWLDLELVAQIKRYFALLTTLHDSYPEVFATAIRDREKRVFLELQEDMRKKRQFGGHHIAMLEHIGLSFDKPVVRGDSAVVRVHGPYRYYIENKAWEFPVDTQFSFARENGVWLINGVQDK